MAALVKREFVELEVVDLVGKVIITATVPSLYHSCFLGKREVHAHYFHFCQQHQKVSWYVLD